MLKNKILWIDDEVDLLKPHIIFLEKKGYVTQPCSNGNDALDLINNNKYDLILLDEPFSGLDKKSVNNFIKVIKELTSNNKSLVISSNIIEIIESIATTTINMDNFNE